MKRKKLTPITTILLIFILTVTILFGANAWIYIDSQLYGLETISRIAHELAVNESDTVSILNNIANWERSHLTYDEHLIFFVPPFLLLRSSEPAWIMTIRRGGCGETASLFSAMAQSVGIQSRVVQNPGEDHSWCEVFVNGTWLPFDPGLAEGERFNNTGFYERPEPNGWGKPLSYVFAINPNGSTVDVTRTYTNTGNLTVQVLKDNLPVVNAKVIVESHSLMDNFGYSAPLVAVENYTNEKGICEFNLGANNYTIIAQQRTGPLSGYQGTNIITLQESDNTSVSVALSKEQTLLVTSTPPILIFVGEITALFTIMILGAVWYLTRSWLKQYLSVS